MKRLFSKYSDKELVEIISKDGKSSSNKDIECAFTELYDRYGLKINAYCRTILNNDELAEDIFQETFLKFFKHVKSNFNQGSVIGFLLTIARNLCLNAIRDNKYSVQIEEFHIPIDTRNEYETKELSDLLMMAIDLIEKDYKEAIILREFNDLRYKEISEIMGITAARARYLVYTGKQKIKTILSPYMKDTFK